MSANNTSRGIAVIRTTTLARCGVPYEPDIAVTIDGEPVGFVVFGAPDRGAVQALTRYARETGRSIEQVMRAVCKLAMDKK